MANGLQSHGQVSSGKRMTLRIDRVGGRVRLSGEFRSRHVHQVKTEIDLCGSQSILDLEEVGLIDLEAIHFLNSCAEQGVSVLNASAYIKEWMAQERAGPAR